MGTREELQAIMDRPGFGTGRAYRDRKAQENEALALLPDPEWMACECGLKKRRSE